MNNDMDRDLDVSKSLSTLRIVRPSDSPSQPSPRSNYPHPNTPHPEVHEFFREGGTLSKTGKEFRPGQYTLAMSIADSFSQSRSGMFEGPCGIGKSFAYLVPAILAAKKGQRTVIAVSTNGLLEQIMMDIPRVCELMGIKIPFASMKGRTHYICQKRVSELSKTNRHGASKVDKLSMSDRAELSDLVEWIAKGGTELTQYETTPTKKIRRLVTITGEECQEKRANRCKWYKHTDEDEITYPSTCNLYVAREAAMAASIVVTNIDVLLWNCRYPGALIGMFDKTIIDEAHELNAKVRDYFSTEKGTRVFMDAADRISEVIERSSPMPGQDVGEYNRNAVAAYQYAEQIRLITTRIHAGLEKFAMDRKPEDRRGSGKFSKEDIEVLLYEGRETKAILVDCESLYDVAVKSYPVVQSLGEVKPTEDGPRAKSDIREHAEHLVEVMKMEVGNFASSVVVKFNDEDDGKKRVFLRHVPIEVGGYLRQTIYASEEVDMSAAAQAVTVVQPTTMAALPPGTSTQLSIPAIPTPPPAPTKLSTVIAVSATLSPDGGWNHPRHQLAMPDDAIACNVPSPFNYRASAIWYTPAVMPEPHNREEFNKAASAEARKLVEIVGGRTLILCSARDDMKVAKEAITGLGFKVYMQDDMPPKALARTFKEDKTSCLIGSKTFGTGFDASGDTLECVILWKLPFSKRTTVDELLRKKLGEPVWKNGYYVPAMLLDLRQWSGRLIRRHGDIGVISILDAAAMDGKYGRRVMGSMPKGINVTRSLVDVEEFLMRARGG